MSFYLVETVDTVSGSGFIACCQAAASGEDAKQAAAEQTEASECRVWGGWETFYMCRPWRGILTACLTRHLLPFILTQACFWSFELIYSPVSFHLVDTVWEAWFIAFCQAGANGEESKGAAAEQTEASQCRVWGGWETKALGQICHLHVQTMERNPDRPV